MKTLILSTKNSPPFFIDVTDLTSLFNKSTTEKTFKDGDDYFDDYFDDDWSCVWSKDEDAHSWSRTRVVDAHPQ